MRRSIAAAVVALSTALSITSVASTSNAAAGGSSTTVQAPTSAKAEARATLVEAQNVMSGKSHRISPTIALLNLRLAMKNLAGRERTQALGLLARPTDGNHDPYGDGYTMKAKKKCKGHFCIHWVPKGADAPHSKHWVNKQLNMMNKVWKFEVGKLGYRAPIKDGNAGGNSRFDVYLKDLFPEGYYGYCAAERPTSYNSHLYSGFCVLDNDFAKSQFGAPPMDSATVTAAHEFFHAIQFGYDALEDSWMLEVSSTWMEERYNDNSNDNRQYLPYGQLKVPNRPLDTFQNPCCSQYANWVFFQYLSEHYGVGIVKQIWNQAASFKGGGHKYSAKAIAAVLARHGGFKRVFAKYAGANTVPGRSYPEGKHYPSAGYVGTYGLSQTVRSSGWKKIRVHHMASQNIRAIPDGSLLGKKWRLSIKVHGPSAKKAPAAYVIVHTRHGKWIKTFVHLNRKGDGKTHVKFSSKKVKLVTITLVNASTKFHGCGSGHYSCSGFSNATNPAFKVKVKAYKG
jgi:hypothetical protein